MQLFREREIDSCAAQESKRSVRLYFRVDVLDGEMADMDAEIGVDMDGGTEIGVDVDGRGERGVGVKVEIGVDMD